MARKKKSDEDETNNENLGNTNDSDDTFGLPEIEYKPLDRDQEEQPASISETPPEEVSQPEAPSYEYEQKPEEPTPEPEYAYDPDEDITPVWPKVLGILIVIVLALGAGYFFLWYRPAQEKARIAKEKTEQEAKDRAEQERLAAERLREEEQKRVADSVANIPKIGVIETLSQRTGRYYVVIASAVDDDLLMDYAKKLRDQAVSTKIIPPFGKYKLFRLAVADGDTFASTQEVANARKAEYGDALWVLKY
jgi:hypothetical protein